MADAEFHVAQFNVSRLLAPLDEPLMREFVAFLGPVNAFAEKSPGFVWRLTSDDGGASSYLPSPYPDPMMITNLTVWTDLESLRSFTFETAHRYFLQNRRKWFDRMSTSQVVLWWIPAGRHPTVNEAMEKLSLIDLNGSSAAAFAFQNAYDPAGGAIARQKAVPASDER